MPEKVTYPKENPFLQPFCWCDDFWKRTKMLFVLLGSVLWNLFIQCICSHLTWVFIDLVYDRTYILYELGTTVGVPYLSCDWFLTHFFRCSTFHVCFGNCWWGASDKGTYLLRLFTFFHPRSYSIDKDFSSIREQWVKTHLWTNTTNIVDEHSCLFFGEFE